MHGRSMVGDVRPGDNKDFYSVFDKDHGLNQIKKGQMALKGGQGGGKEEEEEGKVLTAIMFMCK